MQILNSALIGYGYWGKNLARNLFLSKCYNLKYIVDADPERIADAQELYHQTSCSSDILSILGKGDIDIVVIATPVSTHFEVAKHFLGRGINAIIEKPITLTTAEAVELKKLASDNGCQIFVDHTFLFTGAIKKIKSCVDDNTIGQPYYYDSIRINLGQFHHDVNVIFDLAPHDLSILDYVFEKFPQSLVALPGNIVENGMYSSAYLHLHYSDSFKAHLHLNWLSPVKIRQTIICGSDKMILYNDMDASEKIKIYDKGISLKSRNPLDLLRNKIDYRVGDIYIPKIIEKEALSEMLNHVHSSITNKTPAINNVDQAIRVAKILDASLESLENNGKRVYLSAE